MGMLVLVGSIVKVWHPFTSPYTVKHVRHQWCVMQYWAGFLSEEDLEIERILLPLPCQSMMDDGCSRLVGSITKVLKSLHKLHIHTRNLSDINDVFCMMADQICVGFWNSGSLGWPLRFYITLRRKQRRFKSLHDTCCGIGRPCQWTKHKTQIRLCTIVITKKRYVSPEDFKKMTVRFFQ